MSSKYVQTESKALAMYERIMGLSQLEEKIFGKSPIRHAIV